MDYYAIGLRIRKYRKAHNLSQEELAELVGISTTHMSHIETGSTKLSLPVLVKLSIALEVQTDDLLFDHTTYSPQENLEDIYQLLKGCTSKQLRFIKDLIRTTQTSLKKHFDS